MKRIIAAIFLLSFAVGLSVWAEKVYSDRMEFFLTEIEKIIDECGKKSEEEVIKSTEKTAC